MLKKKENKLILLTSVYPYGKGETFLENEIGFLSLCFEEVLIFSNSSSNDKTRTTPKNVRTILFQPRKSLQKYSSLLDKNFIKEFIVNLFSNPFKNKVAINSWVIANELANAIEPEINSNTILYSYWLDDKAIALSILKNRFKELKVVSRAHRWDIYEEEHLYQYLPFRKFLFKNLNKIYSISSDGIAYLGAKGATNVGLSRLGTIQTEKIDTILKEDSLHLLSISYLIKRKRIDLLVDALQILDQAGMQIKWTHFGDGPETEALKTQSKNIQHIAVDFKGFVSNGMLMQWVRENRNDTVLINLSESEGIPVSMMEAMSFGIPCIGTNVGGVSEIIEDGKNGYLLPPDPSAQEVAKQISTYYNLSKNEQLNMKKNAFTSWEIKYNADKNFHEYCEKLLAL